MSALRAAGSGGGRSSPRRSAARGRAINELMMFVMKFRFEPMTPVWRNIELRLAARDEKSYLWGDQSCQR